MVKHARVKAVSKVFTDKTKAGFFGKIMVRRKSDGKPGVLFNKHILTKAEREQAVRQIGKYFNQPLALLFGKGTLRTLVKIQTSEHLNPAEKQRALIEFLGKAKTKGVDPIWEKEQISKAKKNIKHKYLQGVEKSGLQPARRNRW
jgi:hypothetical protein